MEKRRIGETELRSNKGIVQMQKDYDEMFMQMAISLAKKGWGKTGINPLVGAVVVKDSRIVGKGFHRKIGGAHAEVCAIADAGSRASGATLYVNLEPCCSAGRTPPCVEAICEAKIKRVVIGMTDPNPAVNTRGIEYLKKHNIAVTVNVLSREANNLNLWYKKYITTEIPYVVMKIASSKDGRISGFKEKYVTSEASRRFVHSLRGQLSAVLVGINTVLADDPYLTDRLVGKQNPARVVIDPHLKIPLDSNFLEPNSRRIIITNPKKDSDKIKELNNLGTEFLFIKGEVYPVSKILKELGRLNIGSVLIEGGGTTFSHFFDENTYDEIYYFMAPREIGAGLSISGDILNTVLSEDSNPLNIGEDLLYHVYRNN